MLNQANNACVPEGIQATLDLADNWFQNNGPGVPEIKEKGVVIQAATGCYVAGSCGVQKDWGAVLDDYNSGEYPGGPAACQQ